MKKQNFQNGFQKTIANRNENHKNEHILANVRMNIIWTSNRYTTQRIELCISSMQAQLT